MNALFILPSLSRAGAESQLIGLVNGLGPEITRKVVVCFDPNIDQRAKLNADIEFIHCARRSKFDMGPVRRVAQLIDEKEIDVVHCTLPVSLLVARAAYLIAKRNPKTIAALHTTVNQSRKAEFFDRFLYRRMLEVCDAVVCVCDAQMAYWRKRFPFLARNGQVIHNGINTEFFFAARDTGEREEFRQAIQIPLDAKVVIHVAAFRPEKGHAILLRAFAIIRDRVPNAYLVFAGDGPNRRVVEQLVRDMNLFDSVRFLGLVADVRPLVRGSDVSVLASTAVETFSMAMLESLSMEIPMVVTDLGGAREAIVDGVTGFVVPPSDVDSLAKALLSILEHPDRQREMGRNGRRLVIDEYTERKMVKMTEDLIVSLCASGLSTG